MNRPKKQGEIDERPRVLKDLSRIVGDTAPRREASPLGQGNARGECCPNSDISYSRAVASTIQDIEEMVGGVK